jgi:hypothetical protein
MARLLLAIISAAFAVEGLNEEVTKFDSKLYNVEDAKARAAEVGKPLLVLVTEPWCGACKRLKGSMNDSKEVQKLFAEFVVVLAEGDQGSPWKAISGAGYIPQVLLFGANGVQLDATSGNAKYPYFFGSAQQLTVGMRSALKMAAETPSAKGEL